MNSSQGLSGSRSTGWEISTFMRPMPTTRDMTSTKLAGVHTVQCTSR